MGDPSMFPTWPAKSEQEPGDRNKQASPPPPSGGGAYKKISQDDKEDDETRARGFSLVESVKNKPVVAGWNLKKKHCQDHHIMFFSKLNHTFVTLHVVTEYR